MRPLFTVHAGEFLVGEYIGRKLAGKYDVWLPVRDTGVDLLVTSRRRRSHMLKLQVKFSRSFSGGAAEEQFLARGWYTLEPAKIRKSEADVWVFVILTLRQEPYFVLVPIKELKRRIPKRATRPWHLYITVYDGKKCFNVRDLTREQKLACAQVGVDDPLCNYTTFLENWKILDGVTAS